MRRWSALLVVNLAVIAVIAAFAVMPASAAADTPWLRPVPGRVVRPFRAPLTRFGQGHLGVDLAALAGTPVRASGAGTVVFAAPVATALHVVIAHAGGLETSYSFLATIRVHRGETVARGAIVGTTGGRGENHDGTVLHFALRVRGRFVDPMQLFAAPDLGARVHLAPEPAAAPSEPAAAPPERPDAQPRPPVALVPGSEAREPVSAAVPDAGTVRLRAAVAAGERTIALWRDWVA